MYMVTRALKPVSGQELDHVEQEHHIKLPSSYRSWMERYGEGTYSGWMNVQRPDPEVLKPFVEYDFWVHTDATLISQRQLEECITIGSSVDGDFLAVHPDVEGLLWLPRHDEQITLWPCNDNGASFVEILDRIYCGYYHRDKPVAPAYYEPWNEQRHHAFYNFTGKEKGLSMKALADLCKSRFSWGVIIENEYTCKLFSVSMGGYMRFNYAYEREIALFYETEDAAAGTEVEELRQFLQAHHCTVHE
ncbi:hypothetical protein C0Q44_19840 [Paenibacillus sp. PCH8]|uniref:SMI1/KNR4 family protein n=1 Tax=Paenibacillus sp. PCH8 TaxID=2066524 RepID=UPI000CFA2BAC|nr:SMI1/KNR4 family protein [Paenibacillus sp. PCH8]PQP81920.1 hypothetical protein C0Q44_19840 [Paenibacillus sp. PCH8]